MQHRAKRKSSRRYFYSNQPQTPLFVRFSQVFTQIRCISARQPSYLERAHPAMQPAAGGRDTLKRPARLPPTVAGLKRPAAISPFPAELPSPAGFPFLLPFSRGFFPGSFWGCWEHCPLCESRRSLTGSGRDGRAGEVSSGRAGFVAVTPALTISPAPRVPRLPPSFKNRFSKRPRPFPPLFIFVISFLCPLLLFLLPKANAGRGAGPP